MRLGMGSDVVMREKSFRWPLGADFFAVESLSIGVLLSPRCLGRYVRLYAATNGCAVGGIRVPTSKKRVPEAGDTMPGLPLAPRKVTGHGVQTPEQRRGRAYARAACRSGVDGRRLSKRGGVRSAS